MTEPADDRQQIEQTVQRYFDVAGQVATAKAIDRYLGKRFTDYLSLVKDDSGWRVYNKFWHADPV